jgi:hypothetical protein
MSAQLAGDRSVIISIITIDYIKNILTVLLKIGYGQIILVGTACRGQVDLFYRQGKREEQQHIFFTAVIYKNYRIKRSRL